MSNIAAQSGPAPGLRGIKFNLDWITRPIFGACWRRITIAAVLSGDVSVGDFCRGGSDCAAREWHRMITTRPFGPDFFVTAATIIAALAAAVAWPHSLIPWVVIAAGAAVSIVLAAIRGEPALWQGAGVVYLGAPMLTMLLLRGAPHGAWIIVGLFIAVWATDTGALIFGNLIGGPRLWPSLSPNKPGPDRRVVVAPPSPKLRLCRFLGGHAVLARFWARHRRSSRTAAICSNPGSSVCFGARTAAA